jgi:hypothetical protein
MLIVDPKDDLFHRTPILHKVSLVWREHIYINVYDRNHNFAAVHHFQFIPGENKGLFNCVYIQGDKMERYSNRAEIPGDIQSMRKMTDGKLSVEVIEPKKKLRVQFIGEHFRSDLHYDGRYEVFDYKQCPETGYSPLGQVGRFPLPYNHLVQGLYVTGTLDVDGKKHQLDAVANRDHSWGMRNEMVFEYHYWTGVNFKDRFLNFTNIKDITGEPPIKHGGGICSDQGNVAIVRCDVREDPPGDVPKFIHYELQDVTGKVTKLTFHSGEALGPVWFPNRPVEGGYVYEMLDLWGKWTDEGSGEVGWGLNEVGRMKTDAEARNRNYAS